MTTASGEEVPFLSGMEREPEATHEATIKVGRNLWSIHGMTHRILESLGIVQSRALSMAERGPQDFSEGEFERGVKVGARYGGYNEAPKNGGNVSWNKAILTVACGVALAGILGGVAMYGKLAAVEANQISQQKQLDNLAQMVLNLTRRNQ